MILIGGKRKQPSGLLIALGLVFGFLAALLYILPFLFDTGFAVWRLDPASYFGWRVFTINPVILVEAEFGTSRALIALSVSLTIGIFFLAMLVAFSKVVFGSVKEGLKLGLIGGAVLVVLGLLYGLIYDTTGNPFLAVPVAIASFAGYAVPGYLPSRQRTIIMIQGGKSMFCRNCGKELTGTPEICLGCGAKPLVGSSFCQACGAETNAQAEICLKCGVRLAKAEAGDVSPKSRLAVTLLAAFLGGLGVHRFYLGKIGTGILMLVTLGALGIWSLIDFIMAVAGAMKDKDGKPIKNW